MLVDQIFDARSNVNASDQSALHVCVRLELSEPNDKGQQFLRYVFHATKPQSGCPYDVQDCVSSRFWDGQ